MKKPKKTAPKTWADSLSDTDIQFDKPTKSSLAKRSPRKESTKTKDKATKEDRDLQQVLGELRDMLKISGSNSLQDLITDLGERNSKTGDKVKTEQLELKLGRLKVEADKQRIEAERYKHEYDVMVKQVGNVFSISFIPYHHYTFLRSTLARLASRAWKHK